MGIAEKLSPSALTVVRYAATSAARRNDPNKLDLNLFRGDNRSNYQKSLDLLDLIVEVDFEQSVNAAFDKCYVYSLRKNWRGIIELMAPQLSMLEGEKLLQAYDWLVRSHTQLDEKKLAEAYQRAMLKQARKLRENQ